MHILSDPTEILGLQLRKEQDVHEQNYINHKSKNDGQSRMS